MNLKQKMRLSSFFCLAFLGAVARVQASSSKAASLYIPSLRYTAPVGWKKTEKKGANPSITFRKNFDVIHVDFFGGKHSLCQTPRDFLANCDLGAWGKPHLIKKIRLSHHEVPLYQRKTPYHSPLKARGAVVMTKEEFCFLSLGKRFVVFRYAHQSPHADFLRFGEKAWMKFLASVQAAKK